MSYCRDVVKFPSLFMITCVSLKISPFVVTLQKSCSSFHNLTGMCPESKSSFLRVLDLNFNDL